MKLHFAIMSHLPKLCLGAAVALCFQTANAQIVFKDDFARPGVIPPNTSTPLADTTPEIGEAYTGEAIIFSPAEGGIYEEISTALGGKNIVQAVNAQWRCARWWISKENYKAVSRQVVTFKFNVYMSSPKGSIIFTTLSDHESNGRGFSIYINANGTITWWDGVGKDGAGMNDAGISFETGKAVPVKVVADYEAKTFKATFGEESFEGTFNLETVGFKNFIIYNSGSAEFFYNDAEISIGES